MSNRVKITKEECLNGQDAVLMYSGLALHSFCTKENLSENKALTELKLLEKDYGVREDTTVYVLLDIKFDEKYGYAHEVIAFKGFNANSRGPVKQNITHL